jgi:hypothetical protein
MRAPETIALAVNQTGALADADGSPIFGGRYVVLFTGTLGSSPAVEIKDPAGNWHSVNSLGTDGAAVDLPSGRVRAHLAAGASGAYVYISRVPND